MCGRYASSRSPDDLTRAFEVDECVVDEPLPPDYNVAPTAEVYLVRQRGARQVSSTPRQLRTARWGLVPSWATDAKGGSRLINARHETVTTKPAFRSAVERRRCLLPADGYYEWYRDGGRRQPHFLHRRDDGVLAFAGLYEIWRDPERTDADADALVWSTTIITTAATDGLGHIHDRMPMVVPADAWRGWLDTGSVDGRAACGLLRPAGDDDLIAHPVSQEVGNVRNNGPYLVEPVQLGSEPADDNPPTLW